jgi:hypothetical protein
VEPVEFVEGEHPLMTARETANANVRLMILLPPQASILAKLGWVSTGRNSVKSGGERALFIKPTIREGLDWYSFVTGSLKICQARLSDLENMQLYKSKRSRPTIVLETKLTSKR